jgi:3' exoribonuclease, RNase T-like
MDIITRYPDLMVDIESTGSPDDMGVDTIGCIQIGAVKFNADTQEVGPFFKRSLTLAPNRHWGEGTRQFWMGPNKPVFDKIVAQMEDPQQVIRDFFAFGTAPDVAEGGARFWAKPTTFDYSIIHSYMRQYNLPIPWHFRQARDLNTYMAALAGSARHQPMDHIEPVGTAHDALDDCFYQLKMLFAAQNGDFGPQTVDVVAS